MGRHEEEIEELKVLRAELAAKIRDARLRQELSQTNLANVLGYSRTFISHLERADRPGRDVMTVTTLYRIARALGLRLKIEFVEEWEK